MLNDTINKLIFDFTCHSEQAARWMKDEILNYKASQINAILTEVLAGTQNSEMLWKIDKLEIDLGNIYTDELGTDYILHKFKNELFEKIENLQKKSAHDVVSHPAKEAQIEIIKELLLHGDLPWWVDKKDFPGVDKTMKSAIIQSKDELKSFLIEEKNNRDVKNRIKSFCSPETVTLLNNIVPGITDINPIFLPAGKLETEKIIMHLQQITYSPKRVIPVSESLKYLVIDKLLNHFNNNHLLVIKLLDVFSENEIAKLELYLNNKPLARPESHEVLQILKRLDLFQLEFVLQSWSYNMQHEITNKPENDRKEVLVIINKLKTENQPLKNYLNRASEQSLSQLQTSFRQLKNRETIKKILVSRIIEHPYFLKYNLPGLPIGKLHKVIGKLNKKENASYNKVAHTGEISSVSENKAITKILNSLPLKNLQIISKIILLNKEEIETMLPDESIVLDNSNKTIVENAGLCILAPFLPAFFNRLGFTENGKFKSKSLAYRALYLLQYLVNNRQRNYEYALQLNKLLCGLKIQEPISAYKRLTMLERNEAADLSASVISHWKALKSTSQKGFQLSFLQRKGILTERENLWTLQVEKNSYDLLLDSIPWSFNIIKLPWMNKMIQVEW